MFSHISTRYEIDIIAAVCIHFDFWSNFEYFMCGNRFSRVFALKRPLFNDHFGWQICLRAVAFFCASNFHRFEDEKKGNISYVIIIRKTQ